MSDQIKSQRRALFLKRANEGGVLFDGAIGTQLYERGIFLNQCFEQVSLTQPALVKQVHRDYFEAGAEVLTTNTFGASSERLAKYGLEEIWRDVNIQSVRLAREVAEGNAFIAGSVGPSGVTLDELSRARGRVAMQSIDDQIEVLVEAGVDVICLETFSVLQELELAIERNRHHGVPIVAMYTFQPNGRGAEGQSPEAVASRLVEAGADVIGSNCGGGPELLYEVTKPMVASGVPVMAQANAGRPELIEGRSIYVANHEFFSVYARRLLKAGVKLIGGCCGTTPLHIRRMGNATRMLAPQRCDLSSLGQEAKQDTQASSPVVSVSACPQEEQSRAVPLEERSALGARLARGEFITSVEVNPPFGFNLNKQMKAARDLSAAGVTTINIADGPRASARMSNVAMAQQILSETGVSPIVHVCCRDRSFLGLQAHLLGAHVLGVRNLVVITGDPPKMGPYPSSTGVYDLDSIELLRVLKGYNEGVDPAGKELSEPTSFVLATGAEPAAVDYEHELRRLEMKRDAGAQLVMTQPVYDPRQAERFLIDVKRLGIPVLLGVCPLASYRNAIFLHENVPGMQIPKETLERMRAADERGEAETEGVKIARESLERARDWIQGAYVMPPFGRVYLAERVLEGWVTPPAPADVSTDDRALRV